MAKHDANLDLIFQALSDPTRRSFLMRLVEGPIPVSELARPTGLALPTVMRHLAVLEGAELIETEKIGRVRTCQVRADRMEDAMGWLAAQKAIWEARSDRFEAYVAELMKGKTK